MAVQPIHYFPTGGLNREDNPEFIGDTQVQDSENFLFERKVAKTRPGLSQVSITGLSGNVVWAQCLVIPDNGQQVNVMFVMTITFPAWPVIATSKLFVVRFTDMASVEITGAGFTYLVGHRNAVSFNDSIFIGGIFEGLLCIDNHDIYVWVTGGVAPTYIIKGGLTKAYRYLAAFNTRLVGAHSTADYREVGWCASGDYDTWTGYGAGYTILVNLPSKILSIAQMANCLVLVTSPGGTMIFPTGTSDTVFRFESAWFSGVGGILNGNPGIITAVDGNTIYFVGDGDVYRWELGSLPVPIGRSIRRKFFKDRTDFHRLETVLSFLSGDSECRRLRYHICSTTHGSGLGPPSTVKNSIEHLVLDVEDGAWSRHTYSRALHTPFEFPEIDTAYNITKKASTFAFFDENSVLWKWNPDVACEMSSKIRSRTISLPPVDDAKVVRLLVKARDLGSCPSQVRLSSDLEGERVEIQADVDLGTEESTGKMKRTWVDVQSAGNDFEIEVECAPNTRTEISQISMKLEKEGDYRGA